jgi:NNP family nitrate/nitrite transporter-like MFS transporter
VLFLTLVVYFGILPRLLLAPLLLRISETLGVTYDRASAVFLSGSVGFVIGLFSSGFIANRLHHRGTIALTILTVGTLLVTLSFVRSLVLFHLIFAALNWASGLYPGSGIASVNALAPRESRGIALAIHESGPNLAFLTAPILVAILAPSLGWQPLYRIVGGVTVLVGIAFAVFGRASNDRGQAPHFQNIAVFLRSGPFWIVSVMFVLAASGAMGVYSVLPTYLVVEHGLTEQVVNSLVGLSRVTGFASILLAGTMADRFGFVPVVVVVLGTTGLVTIAIGLASGFWLLAAVFLQPLLVGAFFPLGLTALSENSPPDAQNLAVALAIPLANLVGAGAMPPALAALGAAGHFRLGFVLLGAVTIAALILLAWYPRPEQSVPRVGRAGSA